MILNQAIKVALPMYKITPTATLLREMERTPTEAWVNRKQD